MLKRYIYITVFVLLGCISCEKDGVLHPNLVVLGYPEITSFEPQSGKAGTTINVYGNNFSDQPANIFVSIAGFTALAGSHTMHHMTFVVPTATMTTSDRIYLSVNDKGTNSMTDFTIITPWNFASSYPGINYIYYGLAVFAMNNKGYAIEQDYSDPASASNAVWEYDPQTNVWTRKANMPGKDRYNMTHIVIGSKAYTGLGYTGGLASGSYGFYEYDQVTDSWTTRADYPGERKDNAVGFQIGGKVYVAGGTTVNYEYSVQLWEYDPALDSWKRKNDPPVPMSNAIELSGVTYLTDFEGNMYNYYPESEYYQKITTNTALQLFKGFALQGNLYFFEEMQNNGAWKYNVSSNTWSTWEGPFPSSQDHSKVYLSLDSIGLLIDLYDYGKMYTFRPLD
jgi:hypothetical protein